MIRILKALLLAWVGKKAFDYATADGETPKAAARPKARSTRGRAKHA